MSPPLLILLLCHVTMTSSLKIHVITYNTGNTRPRDSLIPLLGLQYDPDIISAGFEELGDTTDWENEVDRILRKRGYYRVKLVTMSIMQLVIYAKKLHLPHISHIGTEHTKTGFAGTYGNKGGTTIRFRLYDKSVAVVNAHLTAHLDNVEIRDEEYWNIMSEQDFEDPYTEHLYDHDYLIWSGDLNYRLDHENALVRRAIEEGSYLELLEYDQLGMEKQAGHAFIGFHEAGITFPPTYKFDPETDTYDSSEKQRVPSWCDRVLWRIKAEREEIVQALAWGSEGLDCSSEELEGSDLSDNVEVDGVSCSRMRIKKKTDTYYARLSEESTWEKMRRRTVSLMKKTGAYAASTGSAMLRIAKGAAPITIYKADIADPERFRNLMNTLERDKVSSVKEKFENCVRALVYKSYPEYNQSDHKPVAALLEIGVNTDVEPRIRFEKAQYIWKKGEKLVLTIRTLPGITLSSWDWVGLVGADWSDPHKHYLTYQYVTLEGGAPSPGTATFPWPSHPGGAVTLQVVFQSSGLTAPLAVADVTCVD